MKRLDSTLGDRAAHRRKPGLRNTLVLSVVLALVVSALAVTIVALAPTSAEATTCLAYFCEEEEVEEAKPTINIARPRVSVSGKDLNGGTLVAGDQILWTVTVKNLGATLTGIVITDVVPAGTSYVGGSIAGVGANDGGAPTLTWSVGSLDCGKRATVSFISVVDEGVADGTLITNQASADSAQTPPGASKAVSLKVGSSSEPVDKDKDKEGSDPSTSTTLGDDKKAGGEGSEETKPPQCLRLKKTDKGECLASILG